MLTRKLTLVLLLSVSFSTLRAKESVGLVLSGGGAKGVAHIGVIQALEENDIPVDYVAGTSMGSIVGGLYSCGLSPKEMLDLVTSQGFADWSTGNINRSLTYYFDEPAQLPGMLKLQVNFKDSTSVSTDILPGALVNPLPMNFAFMELFSPYTAQCRRNFDNLFVPFRCVCSDVYHKHKVVLRNGSLGDAIRASMSFPMVYKPIELDGVLMFDGGIYDNFPVDVMQEDFNPDFIIGVSVSVPDGKPQPGNMFSQLEDMIIQNNDYSVPSANGIKIQVPVQQFGVLDFQKAREIYNIGYKTGLAMVDSIKSRIQARTPESIVTSRREAWKKRTPALEFDSIKALGLTPTQARYVQNLFTAKGHHEPFDVEEAREAYYRLIASGKIADMRPQAEKDTSTGLFSITMPVQLKKKWGVNLGGYLTSSANSMLFLGTSFHTLSYNALDLDLNGWLGQSYYAGYFSGKFYPVSLVPTYLRLQAAAWQRKYFDSDVLFYKLDNPSFVNDREQYVKLSYGVALGRRHLAEISVGHAWQNYTFFPQGAEIYSDESRDKANYKMAAVQAKVEGSTLDNAVYPSQGHNLSAKVSALYEHSSFVNHIGSGVDALPPTYTSHVRSRLMAQIDWKHFIPLAKKFSLGLDASGLLTIGSLGGDYSATLIHAPGFGPTPSTRYYFNAPYRSFNHVAIGVSPVWKIMQNLQLRADIYGYLPIRPIERASDGRASYGRWFGTPQVIGEVAAVYNFPFASLAIYVNGMTHTARSFNYGLSFGLPFEAPTFLR